MNGQAGKGDSYRPVNRAAYDENYDRIFRKGSNAPAPDDQATEALRCPYCGGTLVRRPGPDRPLGGGYVCSGCNDFD